MASSSTYRGYASVGSYGIVSGTYAGSNRMFTQINIAPLADVFLVLVVMMILLAATGLDGQNHGVLKVNPPQICDCQWHEEHHVGIDVSARGVITVAGRPVHADSASIENALKQFQSQSGTSDVRVDLTSDADAAHKNIVAVMDAAQGAHIKSMRILPMRDE